MACFISGLKLEIQRDIIPLNLETISKAAFLAKLYEGKYAPTAHSAWRKSSFSPEISYVNTPLKIVAMANQSDTQIPNTTPLSSIIANSWNSTQFCLISFPEMQVRKAKGLCFNCDEKFSPSNKCTNQRFLLLHWDVQPLDPRDTDEADFVVELEPQETVEEPVPKVALNAMKSGQLAGTLCFIGEIKGHPIKILLDGGSDENVIQPRIAKFLQLESQPAKQIGVQVGNDNTLKVEGCILDLLVQSWGILSHCLYTYYQLKVQN